MNVELSFYLFSVFIALFNVHHLVCHGIVNYSTNKIKYKIHSFQHQHKLLSSTCTEKCL